MLNFHPLDLLGIFLLALLIFGPKRLPEMGKAIGSTFREFKKSVGEIQESAMTPPATLPPQNANPTPVTQVRESAE